MVLNPESLTLGGHSGPAYWNQKRNNSCLIETALALDAPV